MEERIGHYRIVSELGRGGMGVVYRAHEESLNRYVAIKMLGSHLCEDPTHVERFVREARSAAKLSHPNIVQIYAIDEHEGAYFFVMEYVSGTSLAERLRSEGRLETPEAMRIVLQAAAGLQAAHEQGIIHRDVKPANLMVDDRNLVKITDFGLALAGAAAARLTATGMLMGTPGYLSPEQCRDETVDHRTDIYSLGVTLHEMLTGTVPFKADSPIALLKQIVDLQPPDVCELNPDVDPEARGILLRMMAKDREQRYQNCGELVSDLRQWLGQRGLGSSDPESIAAGAAVAISPESESERYAEPPPLDSEPTVVVESDGGRPRVTTEGVPAETQPKPAEGPPRRSRTAYGVVAVILLGVIAMAVGAVAVRKGIGLLRSLRKGETAVAAVASPPGTPEIPATASTKRAEAEDRGESSPSSPAISDPTTPGTGVRTPDGSQRTTGADGPAANQAAPPLTVESAAPELRPGGTAHVAPPPVADQPPVLPVASPRGAVVVGVGESLLAGQAEKYLVAALRNRGRRVVDREEIPELAELRPEQPPPRGTLHRIIRPHASHLVLVRAEYLGERPLYYMGRQDAAFQARLDVHVIDLSSGRPTVQPFSRQLEYTHLTVERIVAENLGRWLRTIQAIPAGD